MGTEQKINAIDGQTFEATKFHRDSPGILRQIKDFVDGEQDVLEESQPNLFRLLALLEHTRHVLRKN